MRRTISAYAVVALFLSATGASAALTTESCLAAKLKAAGNFRKCRDGEQAKLLQSKPANVAKCTTKFQDKIAKLSEKASEAGIACRYDDNSNGTVTDYDTQLQWEKKDFAGGGANLANPHDVDNVYRWSANPGNADGTAYTDFLSRLNTCTSPIGNETSISASFGGHCDWRLPTIAELQTIRLAPSPCGTSPCIDAEFGPTAADLYWSSTTQTGFSDFAWYVDFDDGETDLFVKFSDHYVRAVRGGL